MFEQHLIRSINQYTQKILKKKALKRQNHLISNDLMSLKLQNMELVDDARQERKTLLDDMNSFLVNEIENDHKYANVTKPF